MDRSSILTKTQRSQHNQIIHCTSFTAFNVECGENRSTIGNVFETNHDGMASFRHLHHWHGHGWHGNWHRHCWPSENLEVLWPHIGRITVRVLCTGAACFTLEFCRVTASTKGRGETKQLSNARLKTKTVTKQRNIWATSFKPSCSAKLKGVSPRKFGRFTCARAWSKKCITSTRA